MNDIEKLKNELAAAVPTIGAVEATTRAIKRPSYELVYSYSVQRLGADNNKIVIRLTFVSQDDKELAAAALAKTIMDLRPNGCLVEAGDDPIMRGRWDFVVFTVPDVRVQGLLNSLLTSIEKAYGN